jgi:hypothetical protein
MKGISTIIVFIIALYCHAQTDTLSKSSIEKEKSIKQKELNRPECKMIGNNISHVTINNQSPQKILIRLSYDETVWNSFSLASSSQYTFQCINDQYLLYAIISPSSQKPIKVKLIPNKTYQIRYNPTLKQIEIVEK